MKLLVNTHGSYVTGTAIADSVMNYGLALARRQQIDLIDIPFIDENGERSRVQLMIGWFVDLTTRNHTAANGELVEEDTVRALTAKAATLEPSSGRPLEPDELDARDGADWLDQF